MKPMFYYAHNNSDEWNSAMNRIQNLLRLINYMVDNKIGARIMCPVIGTYGLKAVPIESEKLIQFIAYHFSDNEPEFIRYYYTIHDELMDMVEGKWG